MITPREKQKRLHYDVTNVGLRAQATAVGFIQLCVELQRVNVIDDRAIRRIKDAIVDELIVTAPRQVASSTYRQDVLARLDRLFAGEEEVGTADALGSDATPID
jgi:hypothetical protein